MLKIALTALVLSTTSAFAADPVVGTWRSQPGDDGAFITVRMQECGKTICGTVAGLHNGTDQGIVGKRIVWDMQPRGGGQYRGGRIWAPDQDKTYNSKMTLNGNALRVEGCVLVICRGQTWRRVN